MIVISYQYCKQTGLVSIWSLGSVWSGRSSRYIEVGGILDLTLTNLRLEEDFGLEGRGYGSSYGLRSLRDFG